MSNKFSITISAVDKTTDVVRKINAQVDKMMAPFDNLAKSVNELGKEAGMNRLVKGMQGVGAAAENVASKVASIVAPLMAVIGVGSIAGIAMLSNSFGKLANDLANQAASIGISTQELQKWQGTAKLAGLSAEDMTGAMSAVGEKLDNAFRTPETVRNMNAIGIEMHRLKNGSIDTAAALLDIAGAMEKQGNAESKKRIADAFGVSAIFPLLTQGRAAVEAFFKESSRITKVFTPEQIEQGKKYSQQMVAVDQSMLGLRNSLGVALLPAMERVISAVDRMVAKYGDVIASKVAEYAERIAKWIDETDWAKVADDIAKFVDKLGGFKTIAIALAAMTFAGPIAGVLALIGHVANLAALLAPLVANPLVIGILGLTHTSDLNAGEQEDLARRRAEYDKNPIYGPRQGGGADGKSAAPISMNDKQSSLISKLRADGYSDAQAAGIVGSLMQESQLDHKAVNPKSGAAGIAQWLGPRKKEFERQYGHSVEKSSFDEQANFMIWELRNTEKRSGGLLRRADTAEKAAQIHTWEYERPGQDEANIAQRQAYAGSLYAAMNKSTTLTAANTPAASRVAALAATDGTTSGRSSQAGAQASTTQTDSGAVAVTVRFENPPKGTSATVQTNGNVSAQVANSEMTGAQV